MAFALPRGTAASLVIGLAALFGCAAFQSDPPAAPVAQAQPQAPEEKAKRSMQKAVIQDIDPNPTTNVTSGHRLWMWRIEEGKVVSFSVTKDQDCDCRKCKPKFD